ncbi:uncharacterized protein LOC111345785 isoform X2 [Stylophora pistillata]|uniref:uncharacterized protein LOC111345785 isoform X2 n=1 Tax=Stylophora pistillata TaxID=50429 RepID=UPI000C055ED2|nr:uncharacterized protein LOC111345785 isoform X2 [Stylophora pistillata]
MVQNCFVTETILEEMNLAELKLKTTMDLEEYNACKVYFERIALRDVLSAQSYSTGTEDEAQIERWKQNTEVVESEKAKISSPILEISTTGHDKEGKELQEALKGALSSEFHSISSTGESLQKQEELKKWKQKTKVVETEKMKGTSLSTKLSIAGYGKELEGKLKTLKLQEEKSTWPVPEFSASDPEEELAELHLKLHGMEVTSPSAIYFTTGHEKEKVLRHETMKLQEKKGTSLFTKLSSVGHDGKELEGKLKTMKLQEEKSILPLSEEELEGLLMKLQRMKGSSPSVVLPPAGQKKELEGRQKTIKFQGEKGSLPSSPLSTTDLEEKLEEVCVKLVGLRKEGSLAVPEPSTSHLVKKLAELCMELTRLRMEGTPPPPELFTANLEEELNELLGKLYRQRYQDRHLIWTFYRDVGELLRQLQEKRTEGD